MSSVIYQLCRPVQGLRNNKVINWSVEIRIDRVHEL